MLVSGPISVGSGCLPVATPAPLGPRNCGHDAWPNTRLGTAHKQKQIARTAKRWNAITVWIRVGVGVMSEGAIHCKDMSGEFPAAVSSRRCGRTARQRGTARASPSCGEEYSREDRDRPRFPLSSRRGRRPASACRNCAGCANEIFDFGRSHRRGERPNSAAAGAV